MSDLDQSILRAIANDDLGGLSEPQRYAYYAHECERMGIDPAAAPLVWANMSGKLRLYAKRTAGDMLAAKHGISTQLTAGPDVRDKVIYCQVRATMPDGRSCEDVGTVAASDPVNGYMKAVTKATRRAVLRLAGWGGLDESELETIPGAQAHSEGPVAKPRVTVATYPIAQSFDALTGKQLLAVAQDLDPADYPAYCERWVALFATYDAPTLAIVRKRLATLPPVLLEMLCGPIAAPEREPGDDDGPIDATEAQ